MQEAVRKLKNILEKDPNRIFVFDAMTGREFSYGDLNNWSLRLASFLYVRGITKGDRMAVILPNCAEFIIFYFAAMRIGAIVVPINPNLTPFEIGHVLGNSGANAVCVSRSLCERMRDSDGADPFNVSKDLLIEFSIERDGVSDGGDSLWQIIEQERPFVSDALETLADDDLFVISYTSGTTDLPKGVAVAYKNFVNNGLLFSKVMGLGPDSKFYAILPLAYMGGWYNLMMIPFLAQGSIVLEREFNFGSALHFWNDAIKYSINALWMVPSIMAVLLSVDRGDRGAFYCKKNIKFAAVGTAPLIGDLKRKFEEKYGVLLYENYGLSETFFIATNLPAQDTRGVGRILAECVVTIAKEDAAHSDSMVRGEIIVKTPFMNTYYNNVRALELMFQEDGVHTGDIGYVDSAGNLFVTGRKKDIIIKGGINISPFEIEEVIMSYPGVLEVAVVGLDNNIAGEEVVAMVQSDPAITAEDIKHHCARYLADFKIPRYIEFTKEFPRSATGKIQKAKVRQMIYDKYHSK